MRNPVARNSELSGSGPFNPNGRAETLSYFILTVLGFSFWFFMVVPFASHREAYARLAGAYTQDFVQQLSFGRDSTYRPLAAAVTWVAFRILDPRVFPTSILRQTLLQGFIYAMFVLAWWLIYSAAPQRRVFAVIACVTGGVFFSGYVPLFHIHGMYYPPVILTLGALLLAYDSKSFAKRETRFAIVATVLALWHPFATALFVGFYSGFYLETFWRRSRAQHLQAIAILLVGVMAIAASVVLLPHFPVPFDSKLFGFLVSYQINEVNQVASVVAFLLTQIVVFSIALSPRLKLAAFLFVSAISVVFLFMGLPLLLLWIGAVLTKLLRSGSWSLFFLMLAAALFPLGGGIGAPIYALFPIIVAAYSTALGWSSAEKVLSHIKTQYVVSVIVASVAVLVMVRVGIDVPIVTRVATPLLAERERTYQLENILAWLHNSNYCHDEIAFAENAGNPIDSVESAITRRNRPPSSLGDVQLFWKTVLQCQKAGSPATAGTAIVTFGGPAITNFQPVFAVKSRYAGDAIVWVQDSQN